MNVKKIEAPSGHFVVENAAFSQTRFAIKNSLHETEFFLDDDELADLVACICRQRGWSVKNSIRVKGFIRPSFGQK